MKFSLRRLLPLLGSALLLVGCIAAAPFTAAASDRASGDTAVYLGDREDLLVGRDSLDGLGMNTAHSGEPITIGSARFDKGVGFHCQPDRDAYVEFDISSLGAKYFAASVGLLREAGYFMEWGSISFHVYGDGELLASTPVLNWGDEPMFLSCSIEGVKKLRLVQNNAGSHACDAGVWGDARLTVQEPIDSTEEVETVFNPNQTNEIQPAELVAGDYAYVSDLYWQKSNTYPGNVVGRDCNTANEIIFSADGTFFPKGVGFHGVSEAYEAYVDVNIDGLGFTKFAAYYGVSETLSSHDITMAQVKFAVFGDGEKLWEGDTMTFGQAMKAMDCDITGVKLLRLAVAGAPHISGAWGTFGGAVLSKSGSITDDLIYQTELPIAPPTEKPTEAPTDAPTDVPTDVPTAAPTDVPTDIPTDTPTSAPTDIPTAAPTEASAPATEAPDASGCSSAVAGAALGALAAAGALLIKRKED